MATQEELNQIYKRELGRDVDASGAETYAGMSVDEVRNAIRGSEEYAGGRGGGGDASASSYSTDYENFMGLEGEHNVTVDEAKWIREQMKLDDLVSDERLQSLVDEGTDQPGKFAEWVAQAAYSAGTDDLLTDYYQTQLEQETDTRAKTALYYKIKKKNWSAGDVKEIGRDNFLAAGIDAGRFDKVVGDVKRVDTSRANALVATGVQRYNHWLANGGSPDEEFGWSEEGGLAIVGKDQNVPGGLKALPGDHSLQQYLDSIGFVAYVDEGQSTGWTGLADRTFGLDSDSLFSFHGMWDRGPAPNEWKASLGPTANLLTGGSHSRDDAATHAEDFGMQSEEYQQYAGGAEEVVVSVVAAVLAPYTAGYSLWAIPAYKAAQGTARKTQGTYSEREGYNWSDVAVEVGIAAATAAVGQAGVVGSARTGGTTANAVATSSQAGANMYAGASSIYGGGLNVTQAALMQAGVSAAGAGLRGGTGEDMLRSGAVGVAGAYNPYAGAGAAAVDTKTRGGGTWGQAAVVGGMGAASAYSGSRTTGWENATNQAAIAMLGGAVLASTYDDKGQRRSAMLGGVQRMLTSGLSAGFAARRTRVTAKDYENIKNARRAFGYTAEGSRLIDRRWGEGASRMHEPNAGFVIDNRAYHRRFVNDLGLRRSN